MVRTVIAQTKLGGRLNGNLSESSRRASADRDDEGIDLCEHSPGETGFTGGRDRETCFTLSMT